jgi:hypothetical protein
MHPALPLVFLLLLAGCAPQSRLVNAAVSMDQEAKDLRECEYEAVKASASTPGNELRRAAAKADVMNACLIARGYRWMPVN